MNLRGSAHSSGLVDDAHPVLAKEETVVENDIDSSPQKLRCSVPDEFTAGEHSAHMLFVPDVCDRVLSK